MGGSSPCGDALLPTLLRSRGRWAVTMAVVKRQTEPRPRHVPSSTWFLQRAVFFSRFKPWCHALGSFFPSTFRLKGLQSDYQTKVPSTFDSFSSFLLFLFRCWKLGESGVAARKQMEVQRAKAEEIRAFERRCREAGAGRVGGPSLLGLCRLLGRGGYSQ